MKLFEFCEPTQAPLSELQLTYDEAYKQLMKRLRETPGELRGVIEKDRKNRGQRIHYKHIYDVAMDIAVPVSFFMNLVDEINMTIKKAYGTAKINKRLRKSA